MLANPKSEFNDRDAYLFIIDVDKILVISNPCFPERTGGNIREHLDWAEKHYGVELCEIAMRVAAQFERGFLHQRFPFFPIVLQRLIFTYKDKK